MKTLVLYYTRTGTTAKAADMIATALGADKEEVKETGGRGGLMGWLRSGMEANQRKAAEVKTLEADPADYDLVVVGTPVWAGTVSSPIRGFLDRHKGRLPQVAFFCTLGGDNPAKTFPDMEEACGAKPVSTMALRKHMVDQGQAETQVNEFIGQLKA